MSGASLNPPRKVRRLLIWLLVGCVVLLPVVLPLLSDRGDTVTFRIVSAKTGEPVANAAVVVCRRWTRLPVEALHLPALKQWNERVVQAPTGLVEVSRVPANSPFSCFVLVVSGHYSVATFSRHDGHDFLAHGQGSPTDIGRATNVVTIALQR